MNAKSKARCESAVHALRTAEPKTADFRSAGEALQAASADTTLGVELRHTIAKIAHEAALTAGRTALCEAPQRAEIAARVATETARLL